MASMKSLLHVTIVTGASAGLGRAMAASLLKRASQRVLCISRRSDDSLQQMAEAHGSMLEQWTEDLADSALLADRFSSWLTNHMGDAQSLTLINNAAFMPPAFPLTDADPADLLKAARVNLEAPLLLTAVFLKATQRSGSPRKVLLISSGLGRRAMGGQAPYCAAKAGLDHLARAVALEEASKPNGAKIVSLAPGVVDTDMQSALRASDPNVFPDAVKFKQLKSTGSLDTPDEAACKVLAWLDRADFGDQPVADVRAQ